MYRPGPPCGNGGRPSGNRGPSMFEPLGKLSSCLRKRDRAIASVALTDGDRVLMVREKSGEWNLPGGRVRRGETPMRAAVREAREETGLRVRLDALAGVYRYTGRSGRVRTRYVFWAATAAGRVAWDGREILAVRWVPLTEALSLGDEELAKPVLLRRLLHDLVERRSYPLGDVAVVTPVAVAA